MVRNMSTDSPTTDITIPIDQIHTSQDKTATSVSSPSRQSHPQSIDHSSQDQEISTPSPQSSPHSTTATTPDYHPNPLDPNTHNDDDDDDDIWTSSPSPRHPHTGPLTTSTPLSDLPTLRRQHMTAGYREGLSIGKARVIQSGFDAGYPVGIAIAMRAGKVVGMLEGVVASMSSVKGTKGKERGDGVSVGEENNPVAVDDKERRRKAVTGLLGQARRELKVTELMGGIDEGVVSRPEGAEIPGEIEVVLRRWEETVGLATTVAAGGGDEARNETGKSPTQPPSCLETAF